MITTIKTLLKILSKEKKKKIPFVLIMMFLGALLETLSVSLIIPVVNFMMDVEDVKNNLVFIFFSSKISWITPKIFIIFIFLLLGLLFILKNIFLYFQNCIQAYFASSIREETQNKLFRNCIWKPYEYYLTANTGDILRNIYVDSVGLFNALIWSLTGTMEIVISCALIVATIIINPMMATACMIIILFMMFILYYIIKPRIRDYGEKFRDYSSKINQWILQITDNIKEVKVMQREKYFESSFNDISKEFNKSCCDYQVISIIPRLVIEAGMISGLMVMLTFVFALGKDLSSLIPQLSAFAFAAIRLLPSVNRINSSIDAVIYNSGSVKSIEENLRNDINITEEVACELKHLNKNLLIEDVTYSYPDSEKCIFQNISIKVNAGEIVGIIGESGAGKTTFVNLILGLLYSDGNVYWDGVKINEKGKKYRLNIGYIPQQINLLDDTIEKNIVFGSDIFDEDKINIVVNEAQLEKFISSLPDGLKTKVGDRGVRLSGGQRQRIGIARALYSEPDFLVLDEATSALDNETEAELMSAISNLKGKKTMIIIAHRLSTLNCCDYIYKMEKGKLILQ